MRGWYSTTHTFTGVAFSAMKIAATRMLALHAVMLQSTNRHGDAQPLFVYAQF